MTQTHKILPDWWMNQCSHIELPKHPSPCASWVGQQPLHKKKKKKKKKKPKKKNKFKKKFYK